MRLAQCILEFAYHMSPLNHVACNFKKLLYRLAHEILVLIVHVPMSLITYPKWMVTCGGGVIMVISHFENIISS